MLMTETVLVNIVTGDILTVHQMWEWRFFSYVHCQMASLSVMKADRSIIKTDRSKRWNRNFHWWQSGPQNRTFEWL